MLDRATAEKLNAINTRFYSENAASFAQTRNAPWEGWHRVLEACDFAPERSKMNQFSRTVPKPSASYRVQDSSFSWATDSGEPQQGDALKFPRKIERSVLDLACGNLRFEKFLLDEFPAIDWQLFAIDNCEPLVDSASSDLARKVHFTCEDIVSNLIAGLPVAEPVNDGLHAQATPFDLVVSFGFMHHIPGFEARRRFLLEALNAVKPGGYLAVSFWQFLNDPARREKAERIHTEALEFFSPEVVEEDLVLYVAEGDPMLPRPETILDPEALEPGDYLLGWKNLPGNYRYCHHFTDEEIDQLASALFPQAHLIATFTADGKTENLNRYLIFQHS